MHRWPVLTILLLLCAFGVAACGGGGDDDVDVDQVLQETFGEEKNIKSGRLDVSLRLDANGLAQVQGPVSVRLAGPFASTGATELPRFDFEASLDAGGQTLRAGAVSTGDKGFVTFQGAAYALSDQLFQQFKTGYAEEAKKNDTEDQGITFKSLGIDPQRWLRDPEYVGKRDVGGTEALQIRSGIDIPRLLEDVNRILGRADQIQGGERARQLTEEERKQVEDAIKDAQIELWTGEEDKIMRRLNVRLNFEVPEAARERANGLTSGTIRFDLAIGAINEEQEIKGPAGAKPFEELLAAVGQGGGAAGGAGGAGGSGGSGGSGGTQAPEGGGGQAATPYERCVQEAGADVAKLQECAGLAGG